MPSSFFKSFKIHFTKNGHCLFDYVIKKLKKSFFDVDLVHTSLQNREIWYVPLHVENVPNLPYGTYLVRSYYLFNFQFPHEKMTNNEQ